MKHLKFIFSILFIISYFHISRCDNQFELVELTTDKFDQYLKDNKLVLVMFYSPDCGYCKAMMPEFEKAGNTLIKENVILARVDGTTQFELRQRYDIEGFPTLKFFRTGQAEEYFGGREEQQIVQWVLDNIKDPVLKLDELGDIETYFTSHDVAFVYQGNNPDELEIFRHVADHNRISGQFIHIDKNGDDKINIKCYRKFEKDFILYDQELNAESLQKWISEERLPLFGEISSNNFVKFADIKYDLVWILIDMEANQGASRIEKYANMIQNIAKDYRDQFRFVWVDTVQHLNHLKNVLLVDSEDLPTVAITKTRPYILGKQNELDEVVIRQFLKDVQDGKVEARIKTEEEPKEEENKKAVIKVVGSNFSKVILNSESPWLLLLTAPMCRPCSEMEELLNTLITAMNGGTKVEGIWDKEIRFAKIDITENDLPSEEFYAHAIPAVYFVDKKSEIPLAFDEQKSYVNLKKFILSKLNKEIEFKDPENFENIKVVDDGVDGEDFDQFMDGMPDGDFQDGDFNFDFDKMGEGDEGFETDGEIDDHHHDEL